MISDHSLKIKHVPVAETNLLLLCDESIPGKLRPLVPAGQRQTIFDNIHNLSHPDIKATTSMIAYRYVWPELKKNVAFWCRNCMQYQKTKVSRHNVTLLQRYPPPSQKFQDINLDLAGPLSESINCTYILVIADRYSRWPVAILLPDTKTQAIRNAFCITGCHSTVYLTK